MPVYPGTEPPLFITGCSIDEVGFLEKKITLYSHTGTHIDAPAHMIKGRKTLDQFPAAHFYGPALMLNFGNFPSETIGVKELEPYRGKVKDVEFLLLHTGWSQYWGTEKYFSNFKVLSLEAANWLSSFGLKGFGVDAISADTADTHDYPVHKALLQRNTIIIENLCNLSALPGSTFTFSCFPLKFEDADGSPVRAVAYIED